MGSERRIEEPDAGPVSPDEAREIAQRFIDRHFDNAGELPRISIPADPKRDDDIRLVAFIQQSAEAIAERDRLRLALDVRALAGAGVAFDLKQLQDELLLAQDSIMRMRRELKALRSDAEQGAIESGDDLLVLVSKREAKPLLARIDAILAGPKKESA